MGVPTPTGRRLLAHLGQAATLALVMMASLALYLAVLWWRGPSATIVTETPWDRLLPFWPAWVWVYLVPYLVGPPVGAILTPSTCAWYLRRGIPLVLTSLLIFILVPTKTVRPSVDGLGDSVTDALYLRTVAIDGPAANAAPSLHVSLSGLLGLALLRDFPRAWPAIGVGVALVWLSTLFTHQHHLVDVATGAILAFAFALPGWRGRSPSVLSQKYVSGFRGTG